MKPILLIAFLPEPLYTVVMSLTALTIVVLFCLFMYKLLLKVLDDYPTLNYEEADTEDISHLHREYYVEEGGKKYIIRTTPEGFVKSISGEDRNLEPKLPVRLTENGTTCILVADNGTVIRQFELSSK